MSKNRMRHTPGKIVLFGSGEMSPTGRSIHEYVLRQSHIDPPIRMSILETPSGFEVNALHSWPERMGNFFTAHLSNMKPVITNIHALRNSGEYSSNNPKIVSPILQSDFIYCGAGSPSYTVMHLSGSLAFKHVITANANGAIVCLGSAAAIAFGRYALPVYEIFKTGEDLHWLKGLDIFSLFGIPITVVPHWNNQEGEDFDTSRCFMGSIRFEQLRLLLPSDEVIMAIDEQTACIVDIHAQTLEVRGIGCVTVFKKRETLYIQSGETKTLDVLK